MSGFSRTCNQELGAALRQQHFWLLQWRRRVLNDLRAWLSHGGERVH